MKKFHTLKLNASPIGAAAPRQSRPAAPVEPTPELPAPAEATAPEMPSAPRKTRVAASRKPLLALLALDAIATLAAVEATGALHSHLFKLVTVLVVSVTAAVVLAGAAIAYSSRKPQSAAPVAAAPAKKGFSTSKAILLLMMVVGIVAYFGGAGTFAGFTAETSNPNDTLASGTLTLKNHINADCSSQAGDSANNVNANCDVALNFGSSSPGQEPGVYVGAANVTLTNTGTLNASKLYLWAPYSNAVYSGSTINPGSNLPASISVYTSGHGPAGVEGPMAAGDLITITSGSQSQSFCVGAGGAAAGASSIPISASCTVSLVTYTNTATITINAGATIQDSSTDTAVGQSGVSPITPNTNCYDAQVTQLGPTGGPYWNPPTYNPLCNSALLFVQETTGGKNYCWWGNGSSPENANGYCTAPISISPTSGVSGGGVAASTTYGFTGALTGNIVSGDKLWFINGANTVECYAANNYPIGTTTSIATNGTACVIKSGNNTSFTNTTATTIVDEQTLTTLASDWSNPATGPTSSDSISSFDFNRNYANKKELTPIGATSGTLTPTGTDLASGAARTFTVGVFIPGPAASQNFLQGLKSTFGLVWHIDQ